MSAHRFASLVLLSLLVPAVGTAQTTLPDLIAAGQWSTEFGLNVRVQGPCTPSDTGLVCVGPFGNDTVGQSLLAIYDGLGWNVLTATGNDIDGSIVAVLSTDQGILVGGTFTMVGGVAASNLALWTGSEWQAFGDPAGAVYALAEGAGGEIYAGGTFSSIDGVTVNRVARRAGGTWEPLSGAMASPDGVDATVFDIAAFGTGVLVAGNFATAGGQTVNGVAAWDAGTWTGFDNGVNGDVYSVAAVDAGTFYIAGNFTSAGGVTTNDAAFWNGADFEAMAGYSSAAALEDNIALVDGNVYFRGDLSTALGFPAGVARWTGSAWEAIAPMGAFSQQFELDGIYAMDGELFIADPFLDTADYFAQGSVLFDPVDGSFRATGDGLGFDDTNGFVEDLVQVGNTLYAGGRLNVAGGRKHCCGLFGRDLTNVNARWQPVGSDFDGQVQTMYGFDDALWVGGALTSAGGNPATLAAQYDPATDAWTDRSAGLPAAPAAFQSLRGTLYAGLDPATGTAESPCLFRFDPTGNQWQSVLDCGAITDPFPAGGLVAGIAVGPLDDFLTVVGSYVPPGGDLDSIQSVWTFDPDTGMVTPVRDELFTAFSRVSVVVRGFDLTCVGGNFTVQIPDTTDSAVNIVCWTEDQVFRTAGGAGGSSCNDPFNPLQCVRDLVLFEEISTGENAKGAIELLFMIAAFGLLDEVPEEYGGGVSIDLNLDQLISSLGVSHTDGNAGIDSAAPGQASEICEQVRTQLVSLNLNPCQDFVRLIPLLPSSTPGSAPPIPPTFHTAGRHDYAGPGSHPVEAGGGGGAAPPGAPSGNFGSFNFAFDWGDAPTGYKTTRADGGPFHSIVPGLGIGPTTVMGVPIPGFGAGPLVDAELDGFPSALAQADDLLSDDENGLRIPLILPGEPLTVEVSANAPGFINLWIDFDSDLSFDAGDLVVPNGAVAPGLNAFTFGTPATSDFASSFARIRFTPAASAAGPTGFGGPGEVEDHEVFIIGGQADFGDAPNPYPTQDADNGARHAVLGTFKLGLLIDAELDGIPDALAEGDDDNAQSDDEDGVEISDVMAGQENTIAVTASRRGALYAWVDFNADGDWNDPDEQIADALVIEAGVTMVSFDAPGDAVLGETFARFRFTTLPGPDEPSLEPFDPPEADLTVGEVEDYRVTIAPASEIVFGSGFEEILP